MLAGTQDAAQLPLFANQRVITDTSTVAVPDANGIIWGRNGVQVDVLFPLPTIFAPGTWVIVAVMGAGALRVAPTGASVTINDSTSAVLLSTGASFGAAMLKAESATNWSLIQLR